MWRSSMVRVPMVRRVAIERMVLIVVVVVRREVDVRLMLWSLDVKQLYPTLGVPLYSRERAEHVHTGSSLLFSFSLSLHNISSVPSLLQPHLINPPPPHLSLYYMTWLSTASPKSPSQYHTSCCCWILFFERVVVHVIYQLCVAR